MEKIISKDGTPIAYEHSGAGLPLVLVHGMAGSHARWAPIFPTLRQHFSVYAGDREEVLVTFLREIVNMPSREIALLQSQPAWSARVAAAHTIPRELRAEAQYKFEPERFKDVSTPTLLL